jgi:UDP-N-acetylmuramoyl-L-alanyl-D-glutamate--2,6-diaminopimelate ligase
MRLDELTAGIAGVIAGDAKKVRSAGASAEVTGLAYDSRLVRPGDLFFCVSGFHSDGHDFAAKAVAGGAAALVVERPLGLGVPELLVSSARAVMGPLAARFFGDPSSELRVVGVTGTNGKTTTAYLVQALLEATGEQCGLLGTVKSVVGAVERAVTRTTPEAIDVQRDLRAMLDGGDRACAMEVSSHALALGRTDGIRFAAAIFTNISRDHLDFHDTMEDYFQAKRRLFAAPDHPARSASPSQRSLAQPPGVSVVNTGDRYGRRLAAEIAGARTFAVEALADYRASEVHCAFDRCSFTLHTPAGTRALVVPMPGRFNVANALGALAAVHALGGDLDVLVAALERGVRVPGRVEPVDEGQDFAVLVDYAHTPDSLENVLRAARELAGEGEETRGRLVCVFGAGGDRDRGKRPVMGEIAARLADIVLVTSDNPRSEDPEQIIAEIMAGVVGELECTGPPRTVRPGDPARAAGSPQVRSISDRGTAIAEAIASARDGDVVVIAGKGHEQGQELAGGRKLPFDDVAVARDALRTREHRAVDDRGHRRRRRGSGATA